jgi:hypothetical protein
MRPAPEFEAWFERMSTASFDKVLRLC